MSAQWYCSREGKPFGPYDAHQITQMIASRELWPNDLLWCDGMAEWLYAAQIPEFSAVAATIAAQPWSTQTKPLQYAHFGRRCAAAAMDAFTLLCFLAIVQIVMPMPRKYWGMMEPFEQGEFIGHVVSRFLLLPWLYFAIMESTSRATFGKLMFNLTVTNLKGKKIGFARATRRYFCKILSAIPLFAGFIMAAYNETHQALHDRLASTNVMRG